MVIFLFLSGCGRVVEQPIEETQYSIGVVLKKSEQEYWKELTNGLNEKAEELKIELIILSSYEEEDVLEQEDIILDLLQKDLDAIAISANDSDEFENYLRVAKEKEIPVFSFDTKINKEGIPYIGSDNFKMGELVAQYLSKNFEEAQNICIISGDEKQQVYKDRVKGFEQYLKLFTSHKIVSTYESNSNIADSMEVAKEAKNQDIDIVFCTSSIIALGAVEIYKNQNLSPEVTIFSFDTQFDILNYIEEGAIKASVSQNGKAVGERVISLIVDSLNGKTIEQDNYIASEIIDKSNVKEHIKIIN